LKRKGPEVFLWSAEDQKASPPLSLILLSEDLKPSSLLLLPLCVSFSFSFSTGRRGAREEKRGKRKKRGNEGRRRPKEEKEEEKRRS